MFLFVIFAVVGCTGTQIQIDQDSKEVIAKIAGRRAGIELAKEYPDVADQVNTVCQEIIAQEKPDLISIAVGSLSSLLAAELDDPLLAADISDILSMIKIEPDIEISPDQMAVIKAVAEGLASGIEMTKK
jgi:hypothetical protein